MSDFVTVPASEAELILRLFLAAVFGGIVGFERERHDRPAGLRTHILVSAGSALLMVVSLTVGTAFGGVTPADPGRIAAQVVSGVGFLGAGTILHEGPTIRGLTTAASLWVVAALGLAAGAGLYVAAASSAVGAFLTLSVLSRVERFWFSGRRERQISVRALDRPGQLGAVAQVLGQHGIDIKTVELNTGDVTNQVHIEMVVRFPKHYVPTRLAGALLAVDGVVGIDLGE